MKICEFCGIFVIFGEIQHLSWIRGPKTFKYCKYYVCFPHVAPRARPFSENIGFLAKKLEFSQKLHILWKLLISTKFPEICPPTRPLLRGTRETPSGTLDYCCRFLPIFKTPLHAGAHFHEKEHFSRKSLDFGEIL